MTILWQKLPLALFVVAIGFVCSINGASIVSPPKPPAHKCDEATCVIGRLESAAQIMKHRDTTINPCDNFYRYVCGNFEVPEVSSSPEYLEAIKDMLLNTMIGLEAVFTEYKPFQLIEELHDTCMNDSARGPQDLGTLKESILWLGGWPLAEGDKWKEDDFDWMEMVKKSKLLGYNINYLLDWNPEVVFDGEHQHVIFKLFTAPTFFEFMMSSDDDHQTYKKYMAEVVKLLDVEGDVTEELNKVFEFEKKISDLTEEANSDDDEKEEIKSIEALKEKVPSFDWDDFIVNTLTSFMDVDDVPVIEASDPDTLTKLIDLIKNTPKRVQANYIIWRMIQYSAPYLTTEIREKQKEFWDEIGYVGAPHEKDCEELAKHYMNEAVEYFFLEQYKEDREVLINIAQSIKNQLIKMMKDSTTLTAEEKEKGVKIITDMPVTIGPSAIFDDPSKLEKLYENAKIYPDNYLKTLLRMNTFRLSLDYSNDFNKNFYRSEEQGGDIGEPDNFENQIYIPTKILDSLIFDNERPMYMNYAAAGMSIARAMFESIQDLGVLKDKVLTEQVICFSSILGNISDPETHIPVIHEGASGIAAQYIGFRAAYNAYKDYVAENGAELPLPEVPYTPEQLFWISFVEPFCSANVETEDDENVEGTSLKLLEFTLMKVLANIPEISTDFACPAGTPINPEKKCAWW
ncbi:neprilysin-2-like [Microplitis mediator]|uniref:neprilysin-2-like n=1 Tax=Microplitis mediator TaxID=375433 RepID=UPI0025523984|nr:neprilysin-2-like [Microplitis mediator]